MLLANDATLPAAIAMLVGLAVVWTVCAYRLPRLVCRYPVATVAGAAAVARVVPSVILDRGLPFDIEAHWWVGVLALSGRNVYTAPLAQGRYPYPPLHAYISALLVAASGYDRGLFLLLDKLLPAVCGILLSLVILAAARRLGYGRETAVGCALLYALNPLAMLVTGYHGQFEEIPLLGIGVALMLLVGERRPGLLAISLSALALGGAVAYKTWPLLFALPLLMLVQGWRRRLLYAVLTAVPLVTSLLIYSMGFGMAGLRSAVGRVLGYGGSNGFCWGYVSVLHTCWVHPEAARPNGWVLSLNSKLLIAAVVLTAIVSLWRLHPFQSAVALTLAFYVFSPGWGPNYSVWILPFAVLLSPPLAVVYTAALLPLVSVTYLDSLYAAYGHTDYSWAVLKELEGALGFVAWLVVVAMALYVILPAFRLAFWKTEAATEHDYAERSREARFGAPFEKMVRS